MIAPPHSVPLRIWAKQAGVNPRTARSWAADGVLDGGDNAARVGHPGVHATKVGPVLWFVSHVPQQAPEPEPDFLSRREVADLFRKFADLLDGNELDTFAPGLSAYDGRSRGGKS